MICAEMASGDRNGNGCCEIPLPLESEGDSANDSIVIDDELLQSIAETETEVTKRLGKLRSRLDTITKLSFDFSPFVGEAERYASNLGVLKGQHSVGLNDPHLVVVLDAKPLGRQASEAASYLMTHATMLESRTRHDLLSDLWLVNLAHELSQTLRARIDEHNNGLKNHLGTAEAGICFA